MHGCHITSTSYVRYTKICEIQWTFQFFLIWDTTSCQCYTFLCKHHLFFCPIFFKTIYFSVKLNCRPYGFFSFTIWVYQLALQSLFEIWIKLQYFYGRIHKFFEYTDVVYMSLNFELEITKGSSLYITYTDDIGACIHSYVYKVFFSTWVLFNYIR